VRGRLRNCCVTNACVVPVWQLTCSCWKRSVESVISVCLFALHRGKKLYVHQLTS
jgi:hypothetical protein